MANDIAGSPLILDTVEAVLAATVKVRNPEIRWVGATTAGHVATITDAAGRVIWTSEANAANYVERDIARGNWLGLTVSALQSGILYVYLAPHMDFGIGG